MRYGIVLLAGLFLFTPPATAQVTACDEDCLGIMQGTVQWLIDDKDYERSDIVLNTSGSRIVSTVRGDVLNVEASEWFANRAGVDHGAQGVVTDCENRPVRSGCALRRGEVFLTIGRPPQRSDAKASVPITIATAVPGDFWPSQSYILTLARDEQGAWHVTHVEVGPVT